MCGIIGALGNNLNFDFVDAVKKLSHRGPDDIGFYKNEDGNIQLGHTRLAIIDLSKSASQPMIDKINQNIIIFNGEIYNFEFLKKKFLSDTEFNSNSDTEVLLKLYNLLGIDMLNYLDGIFAFAIFDKKTKEVFLVRDHYGIKPIYYIELLNQFYFASEPKALINIISDLKDINYQAITNYLTFQWSPGNQTPLKKLNKLGPGEYVVLKDNKIINRVNWYQLPTFKNNKVSYPINDLKKQLENKLRNAVHKQMLSDVPLGCFLSGGLDSSSIAKFASEINPDLSCYTIEIEENDGFKEDLNFAKKVSKILNVKLDVIKVTPADIIENLQNMVFDLDEPLGDPAPLNVYFISKLARKNGHKVLLSGTGGDDIFSGYRRHLSTNIIRYTRHFPKFFFNFPNFIFSNLNKNSNIIRRINKLFSILSNNKEEQLFSFYKWADDDLLKKILKKDYHYSIKNTQDEFTNFFNQFKINKNYDMLDEMLLLDQRFFLTDHNLCYTDKMSMKTGVEVRVPFLDKELVEFASTIENRCKQSFFQSKNILKITMEKFFSKDIIYRPKTGFGLPLRSWIKNDLYEYVNEILSKKNIDRYGIFNFRNVRLLIENNKKGTIDASYTIFSLMCIQMWLDKFYIK